MRGVLGAVAAVTAVALLAGGCAGGDDDRGKPDASASSTPAAPSGSTSSEQATLGALADFYTQVLSWSDCRDGFECARIEVPLDYEEPRGRTITLAVVRLPAGNDDPRGSLVLNPGGPGVSGVDYARAAESVVSDRVRKAYDIVGFDPRGVARSAPVECLDDRELDEFVAVDGSPDTAAEEARLAEVSRGMGQGCARLQPDLTQHVGTRDAARDLDLLRAVLGDPRLNYLGASYGTFLGLTFAELFPRRVGRLVLDGVFDPSASSTELAQGQAAGFQQAFRSFLADCLPRRGCPLSGSLASAEKQVGRFLDAVDRKPLRGEDGRQAGQALTVLGIAAALYDQGSWPLLRRAFAEGRRGRGATFLALADFYTDRGPDGKYATNALEASYAVNCVDRPEDNDAAGFRASAVEMTKISPVFGAFLAWGTLPCVDWPAPVQGRPHEIAAKGAKPILLVGTTRDPATPYAAAQSVEKQLNSGHLLTLVGDGHTAYGRGSKCIDTAIDRYLIEGKLPADGTRCR
jgi:pimeloyl-ACP methyl ester carboxylesterase